MTPIDHIAFLGSLGTQELIIIFVIILLLFGSKKLPQLARGVGKSMGEFKKAKDEFEHEITRAEEEASHQPEKEAARKPEKSEPRKEKEESS